MTLRKVKTIRWGDAKVTSETEGHSLNIETFRPTAYEGVRAYRTAEGGLVLLEPKAHLTRLRDSARFLGFRLPYSLSDLYEGLRAMLEQAPAADYYITIQATEHSVEMIAIPDVPHPQKAFVRIANNPRGYPAYDMQCKTPSNFQTSLPPNCTDILFTNATGYVTGGSKSNIFVIKNRTLITPPADGSILEGITRYFINVMFFDPKFRTKLINLNNPTLPLHLVEKSLTKFDIFTADEIFLCSTRSEIVPVLSVNDQSISDGQPGAFTKLISSTFQNIVREKEFINGIYLERVRRRDEN